MGTLRDLNFLSLPAMQLPVRRPQPAVLSPLAQAIQVLQEHPNRRKEQQLQSLAAYLADIKFFVELAARVQTDAIKTCCKYLTYEAWRKGEVVFRRGDPGTKFFILLSGCAGIYVRPTAASSDLADRSTDLQEVKEVHPGETFGELALITNASRAATVQCKSDCHFAVLEKKDYLRILGKLEQVKLDEIVDFLLSLPLFKGWGKQATQRISYYFTPIKYIRKQFVYRSHEKPTHMYIIWSGEFEFVQDIAKSMEGIKQPKLGSKQLFHKFQVTILGRGEVFGDKEIVEERTRMYTCSCLSSVGTLLVMTKEDFVHRALAEDGRMKLQHFNAVKANIREARVQKLISLNSGDPVASSMVAAAPKPQLRKTPVSEVIPKRKKKAIMADWRNVLRKFSKKKQLFRDQTLPDLYPKITEKRLSTIPPVIKIPEMRMSFLAPSSRNSSFANSPTNKSGMLQSEDSWSFDRPGTFKSDAEDDQRELLSRSMEKRVSIPAPMYSVNWCNSLRKRS